MSNVFNGYVKWIKLCAAIVLKVILKNEKNIAPFTDLYENKEYFPAMKKCTFKIKRF